MGGEGGGGKEMEERREVNEGDSVTNEGENIEDVMVQHLGVSTHHQPVLTCLKN